MTIKYTSFATGIGAPDEAVRNMNWECVAYSEIDEVPKKYYKIRNPKTGEDLNDFSKLKTKRIKNIRKHNLSIASLPCQSFSISGNRKGFEDHRGNLFFDFLRIIKITRPDYLVMENVKGLCNHDKGKTLATIEAELEKLEYQTEWSILNSKNFGVPQNRERIYLIGRHSRTKPRGAFFPLRKSNPEDSRRVGEDLSYCLDANYWKGTNTTLKGRRQLIQVNKPVHSNNRVYDPKGLSPTLRDMSLGGNRQPFILTERRNAKIRRLTPLECWRLQGFPDECYHLAKSSEIGMSNTRQYKALGNAITVPVFRAIAERLEELID